MHLVRRFVHHIDLLAFHRNIEGVKMLKGLIFPLLCLVFTFCGCKWFETRETYYPNLDAAVKAGEVERGWIPLYVPKSATDIRIKYDIENNQTWLAFRSPTADLSSMWDSCKQITQSEISFPPKRPSSWWPLALTQDQKPATKYRYYTCKEGGFMAIHENEIFYWYIR